MTLRSAVWDSAKILIGALFLAVCAPPASGAAGSSDDGFLADLGLARRAIQMTMAGTEETPDRGSSPDPAGRAVFSHEAFHSTVEEIREFGMETQLYYVRVRDELCAAPTDACADGILTVSGKFARLNRLMREMHNATLILEDGKSLPGLAEEDRRCLRRDYGRAFQGLSIWVHGLDQLLNMKAEGRDLQRRLSFAQTRFQKKIEDFGAKRDNLAVRFQALLPDLPSPNAEK